MQDNTQHKPIIGIVLSTVPRYSETFFRNKIKGLESNGYDVILFVDYLQKGDLGFPSKIVASSNFGGPVLSTVLNSVISLLKLLFLYPKRGFRLYQLDKQDGKSFKKRIRNLIVNQFLLSQKLDWLHFGFGMLSDNRENVAQAIGAKMAVSFRGFDLYLSPLKHKNCYDILFTKSVEYHVLSQEMKRDLMDYNISEEHIKVIPPAIDIHFFKSENRKPQNEVVQLITVARLHWKKGLEYTLEALLKLKESGINFHYTIVGEGSELERLMFTVHQLNLQQEVTFAGKMPQEDVKRQLEKSDIYLQYSIQEGFCNAVLEAQVMGLMCIVSNAEGLSENVLNGKTGWVVPKRQPQLLLEKIMEVRELSLVDKEFIKSTAIQRVRHQFNLELQNDSFCQFYTKKK
jgi:glycosyltransferase involved in cell wall biosynthesis